MLQQQVLNCINRMGGSLMRERMIEALGYINDELKQQVVIQLGNIGGKDVGEAFCALLEKRAGFTRFIEEDLTIALCTKIKFLPSPRAIQAVKAVIAERMKYHDDGDRVLLAEVYAAGEAPIVAADGRSLARALRVAGKVEPVFVDDIAAMPQAVMENARDGDVVLCMGAGSIGSVPGQVMELARQGQAGN